MSERFAFLLHYRPTTQTRHYRGQEINFLFKSGILADLRTFSRRALSFQPVLDASEAEEVSAAQRRQPVLARRRPRLEADAAVVAFAFLAVWGLEGS